MKWHLASPYSGDKRPDISPGTVEHLLLLFHQKIPETIKAHRYSGKCQHRSRNATCFHPKPLSCDCRAARAGGNRGYRSQGQEGQEGNKRGLHLMTPVSQKWQRPFITASIGGLIKSSWHVWLLVGWHQWTSEALILSVTQSDLLQDVTWRRHFLV